MMLNKQEIRVYFGGTVLIVSSKPETGKGNNLAASFASLLLSFMQVAHPLTLTPSAPSEGRPENYITLHYAIVIRGSRVCGQLCSRYEAAKTAVTLFLLSNDDIRMTVHLVT